MSEGVGGLGGAKTNEHLFSSYFKNHPHPVQNDVQMVVEQNLWETNGLPVEAGQPRPAGQTLHFLILF